MSELPFPFAPIRHPQPLAVDQMIPLDARAADALRFRQVNVSEAFTLADAEGRYFRASLKSLRPRGGEALVYEEMARAPESPLALTLVCAVLARQRMLLAIPKATELGVVRIQPVISDHSVQAGGLEHEKAHAWQNAALRAARQCRRSSVPEVCATLPLRKLLSGDAWRSFGRAYYLDDRAGQSAALKPGFRAACLTIGPEGGWSDEERELLQQSGAQPLALGGRVLRAETAVIAGTFLMQYVLGDLGPA
jgi:16S rRNA (uracil1498-N3)-methyltransferase